MGRHAFLGVGISRAEESSSRGSGYKWGEGADKKDYCHGAGHDPNSLIQRSDSSGHSIRGAKRQSQSGRP